MQQLCTCWLNKLWHSFVLIQHPPSSADFAPSEFRQACFASNDDMIYVGHYLDKPGYNPSSIISRSVRLCWKNNFNTCESDLSMLGSVSVDHVYFYVLLKTIYWLPSCFDSQWDTQDMAFNVYPIYSLIKWTYPKNLKRARLKLFIRKRNVENISQDRKSIGIASVLSTTRGRHQFNLVIQYNHPDEDFSEWITLSYCIPVTISKCHHQIFQAWLRWCNSVWLQQTWKILHLFIAKILKSQCVYQTTIIACLHFFSAFAYKDEALNYTLLVQPSFVSSREQCRDR